MTTPFERQYAGLAATVEAFLPQTLEWISSGPVKGAIRHVLCAGGKRLRPVICLAVAGRQTPEVLHAAAALEWLHTYSLVHDDLPALDNDDWRRGQPTLHTLHGEAAAILMGDALHAGAFALIGRSGADPAVQAALSAILAEVSLAMVEGQVTDTCPGFGIPQNLEEVLAMTDQKTGALLTASFLFGACLAGTSEDGDWRGLGRAFGRCFQLVDDLLDRTGSLAALGKTPGKDDAQHKVNLLSFLGEKDARLLLRDTCEEALAHLRRLPLDPSFFEALLAFVVERDR